MDYKEDDRIVMTLDAGGTNLVFSAIQRGEEIVAPITLPSCSDDLNACLNNITEGFNQVKSKLPENSVAISFAFPGPADYPHGIIGNLPNFPSFRGGIALGPFLERKFQIPVFINNDGDLFAYGEAMTGALQEINARLEMAGSNKRYKNLLGLTFGTGFGAGVVIDGRLLRGDNSAGGDIWCFRNKLHPNWIAEESVSIRGVCRVYHENCDDNRQLTPKDIFDIAEGNAAGNKNAALKAFSELGEVAGNSVASAITLIDGIIVLGGGIAHSHKYIIPSMIREMSENLSKSDGESFPRLQMKVFNLEDDADFQHFAKGEAAKITVPGSDEKVDYDPFKRIGIMVSKQGTSRSVALGAYMFALMNLK